MKRILCLLLILSTILYYPAATYAEEPKTNNNQQLVLTLDSAYKMLADNNLDIQLLNKKIDLAVKKNDKAIKASKEAVDKFSNNEITDMQYRKDERLNWRITKLDLEDLNNQKSNLLKSLKYSIKQQYVNILLIDKDIEILNSEITNIDKKLNEIQLRMKLGQVKETEYKQVLAQKLSLQSQLNDLKKQKETAMINMKKSLGINLATIVKLNETTLPYAQIQETELEKAIQDKSNNSFDLNKLKQQLENKKIERQINLDYSSSSNSSTISNLDNSILELENKISQQAIDTMVEYWNDYYELLSLKDNIALAELSLDIEQLNYSAIQAKTKLGMVDATTESNARISYNRQKNSYQRAMYNYILAAEQFNEKLGVQQ